MEYTVLPLTPERWPAFEDLFGPNGAVGGCWCMFWRIGNEYHRQTAEANKAAFFELVHNGPPPGLLAYSGEAAVGWCQLTPRDALPWLNRSRRLPRVDDAPVWSISCFYIRRGWRKRGVASALIAAAVEAARRAGAPALEAYPVDASLGKSSSFTGYLTTYLRAGFEIVARPAPNRPIVRCTFAAPADPADG